MHAAFGTFPLRHGAFQQDHFRAKILSLIYAFQNHQPMNRKLLVSLSFLIVAPAFAQPSLISPGNAPTPGTSFQTRFGAYRSEGPAGASQNWNFASLVADSSAIVFVELPSATPQGTDFPNATAAVINADGTQYFQASSGLLELVGPSLLGQTAPLSNPASFLPFPCTFNSSWEDDFAGSIDVMGFPLSVTGNVIGIADGFGTLELPEGTVNDVLRVRRITTTVIDITGFGSGELEENAFAFYKVGLGLPVLEVSTTTGELPLLGAIDLQNLKWVDVNTVGFADLFSEDIGMEVFPNPATDMVQVNFGLAGGRAVAIELFDLHGRQVQQIAMNTGNSGVHIGTLDVSGLTAGMYMIRITDNAGRVGTGRVQVL